MPLAGTAVLPGANFTFTYNPHADYGLSSFAFHVWLLTGEDPDEDFGNSFTSLITSNPSGYYFGRFDYPNYPGEIHMCYLSDSLTQRSVVTAVPYAKNPPPPQLTMPDFSKSPGGFASGSAASNLTMRLVVIEEWGNSQVSVCGDADNFNGKSDANITI